MDFAPDDRSTRRILDSESSGRVRGFDAEDRADPNDPDKTLERVPSASLVGRTVPGTTTEISVADVLEEVSAANATQEVQLNDVLEMSVPQIRPTPAPIRPSREPEFANLNELGAPASMAPLAFEVQLPPLPALRVDRTTVHLERTQGRNTRRAFRRLIVVSAIVPLAVLGVGLARQRWVAHHAHPVATVEHQDVASATTPSSEAEPVAPKIEATAAPKDETTAAPKPTATTASTAGTAPAVDLAALPAPTVGTITGPSSHRLYIDGALAPKPSAVVHCGKHVVKIGSAGAAHAVDVPCGGEVSLH